MNAENMITKKIEIMEQEFYERFPTYLGLFNTEEIQSRPLVGVPTSGDKRIDFVMKYYDVAIKVGKKFNLHPLSIMAQASVESGWGTSTLASTYNNFFGITAAGKPNAYWKGGKYTSKSSGLTFRTYNSVEDGFSDFARLITSYYKQAAAVSNNIGTYAEKISNSPYISEVNGDNRTRYKQLIMASAATILTIAKKKSLSL